MLLSEIIHWSVSCWYFIATSLPWNCYLSKGPISSKVIISALGQPTSNVWLIQSIRPVLQSYLWITLKSCLSSSDPQRVIWDFCYNLITVEFLYLFSSASCTSSLFLREITNKHPTQKTSSQICFQETQPEMVGTRNDHRKEILSASFDHITADR